MYLNRVQYYDLYTVLPSYISTITEDIKQNIIITIKDNLTFTNSSDVITFGLDHVRTKKHYTLPEDNYLTTNSLMLINNANLRIDISNSSQNLDN